MSAAPTLEAAAQSALTLPARPDDRSLIHRATRLAQLVTRLSREPEMADIRHDTRAAEAAALFFEIARVRALAEGALATDELLTAAIEDNWREASVDALNALPDELLSARQRETAIAAVRAWNRVTDMPPEAILLAEAVHLEDMGPIQLWHEARRGTDAEATLRELLKLWKRRQDYGYWDARIRENLRFESSRKLARRRVAAMQVLMESLAEQLS